MIYSFEKNIALPKKSKNIGYMLIDRTRGSRHGLKILKSALDLFSGGFGRKATIYNNKKYIFFILQPEKLQKLDLFSVHQKNNDFAFIEGTFYDKDLLLNDQKTDKSNSLFAKWVYDKIVQNDIDILKNINGNYSGFIYISSKDILYCFNDKFGINKQFFYDQNDFFAITNNIYSLVKNSQLTTRINNESICQILQLDYPLKRNTEFLEISHILPSEILIRHKECRFIKLNCYKFERAQNYTLKKTVQNLYEKLDSFINFLSVYLNEPCGLFLSRGKDARILLNLLDKNFSEYSLFNFKTEFWADQESADVEKIAKKLLKDLFRLEKYFTERNESLLAGMNTTAASAWFALSGLASEYTNFALIGHGGDKPSGKCYTFRDIPAIKTKSDLANAYFRSGSKNVYPEEINSAIPFCKKSNNIKELFYSTYDNYQDDLICDIEIKHSIENRWFRHTLPILHKSNQYITPIYPYLEKNICQGYFNLPVGLIRSQKAHAHLACLMGKTNFTQSTEFPIPLNIEKHIRPMMMSVIKLNNRLNDNLFKLKTKKLSDKNRPLNKNQYEFTSSYLKEIIGNSIALRNRILLHRLMVVDTYLYLSRDFDFSKYCNKVESIKYSEHPEQNPDPSINDFLINELRPTIN